jgi:hypothetical protein
MTGSGEQPEEQEESLSLVPDFIENVEQYLATHKIDNVDILIDKLQQKLQVYTMAENRALTRRQKQLERQAHLNKSIACVKMLLQKQASEEEAIVDYSLGGARQFQCAMVLRSCTGQQSSFNHLAKCCSKCLRSSPDSCCQERLPVAGSGRDGRVSTGRGSSIPGLNTVRMCEEPGGEPGRVGQGEGLQDNYGGEHCALL